MKKLLILIVTLCSFFLHAQSNPKGTQNEYLLAENYYREGAYEKAAQFYRKLYNKSPFNTSYLSRLLSCYQETENYNLAEKLLKEKISTNSNQVFLHVYLGYNYQKQQLLDKANENYEIALNSLKENAPNNNYGGLIGRIFKEYNLLDKAILAYEKAMLINKNANYSFQIAQIYGEQGNYKKMFESYINLVDNNNEYVNLLQRYTSKYITDDAENEANILFRKTLLKASVSKPKPVWNLLLSWLFTQQKEYDKALVQEKALFQRKPEDLSAIFMLGKIAFENKEYETANSCFEFVIEKSPYREDKIAGNLFKTKIAIANNNTDTNTLFLRLFKEYGINQETLKLQIAYADFLTFTENKPEKGREILEEAIRFANSKFDKARIKLKLGDILVFTGNYNKALIYFSQVQTQLKNDELAQEARFKVAQTSYFKGDFNWAKAQLKVLKGATTQLIANDAVALFLKITDNEPVDSIPSGLKKLANAELLAFQNKNKEALDEIEKLFKPNDIFKNGLDASKVIYDDVLYFKAKILLEEKKYDLAIKNLQEIINSNPEGYLADDCYFMIAEIHHYNLKNLEEAKNNYQKILFDFPASIYLVDARKKYRKLRGDAL